jgi:Domain of unknown function (DUF4411)
VPPSGTTYIVDTDVMDHIRWRADSTTIYSGLIGLAKNGTAKTVRQVFGELKKHKATHKILGPHERDFLVASELQFCSEVQAKLELVKQHANHLWEQVGGKNPDPADPWLVAVASAHGFVLVTDENQISSVKIPAVCKLPSFGCKCISGPHFLIEVGLVKEIKPEHISPQAFFGIGAQG